MLVGRGRQWVQLRETGQYWLDVWEPSACLDDTALDAQLES